MHRLKATEVAAYRTKLIEDQDGGCALCGEAFTEKNPPCLDHDHTTGKVRGVLHRGCNAMLGVIENNGPRYFLTATVRLSKFLRNLLGYVNKDHGEVLYPTHRSTDEKRLLRNKRAAVARKARKAA